jgi:hypothetical protein
MAASRGGGIFEPLLKGLFCSMAGFSMKTCLTGSALFSQAAFVGLAESTQVGLLAGDGDAGRNLVGYDRIAPAAGGNLHASWIIVGKLHGAEPYAGNS